MHLSRKECGQAGGTVVLSVVSGDGHKEPHTESKARAIAEVGHHIY
jgi:hypothetical protein